MNNISKTFQSQDIFNSRREYHSPQQKGPNSYVSNTFKSNLPIFQTEWKYPAKKHRRQQSEVYQPKFEIEQPKTMLTNEIYGPESMQKMRSNDKENRDVMGRRSPRQQHYSKEKQRFNEFNSSNIFHQEQPCFESFNKQIEDKQIEKGIERVVMKGDQNDFQNLKNIHKKVIDTQKSQIEELGEYNNIRKGFVDDDNLDIRKQNHNYSNMFELQSNPQKVIKVEGILKNPDTVAWYKVDSIQTENQLKEYTERQQMPHREKKKWDLQGTINIYNSQTNNQHIQPQNNNYIEQQQQQQQQIDGNDNKSMFYKEFHSSSVIEQPKSYNQINGNEMKVIEFKLNQDIKDEQTFIKKCKQNGNNDRIHLLNYEHQHPTNQLYIQNGKFKIRMNEKNGEQMERLQKVLDCEGVKVNEHTQNINRKNKKVQECSNVDWSDQRVAQEQCTNNNPELDCYTRKVNNLQVSDQQTSKHSKNQMDKSEVHHPQSLMVMHDYYRKVNNLQKKLNKMSQQQKKRK